MEQQSANTKAAKTGPNLLVAALVTALAIAAWAALRAYTGIFGILNLRVFVGAILVAVPMVAAGAMQWSEPRWKLLQSVVGLAAVVGGEGVGSYIAQSPPVLDKFTLIYFGIAVVLPWLKTK
jgi:hypothetical protein